jgi:hypothetical protein
MSIALTTTDLIPWRTGALAQFNPVQTRERVSVLSAVIAHAKRIRDWEAVHLQVEEQQSFNQFRQFGPVVARL